MAPQRTTIRRKLMTAIMGTSITVLVLTCAAFITYEVVTFRTSLVRGQATRAELIAANSTAALAFENVADATEILSAFRKDPHMVAACLYDKEGRIFAEYRGPGPTDQFPELPEKEGHHFGKGDFVIFQPVVQGQRRLGTLYMKSDLSAMTERYRVYTMLVLIVILSSVLLAYALSIWLQKRIAQPILKLADTARVISERKDYFLRTRKFANDEIGLLTDSFNDMLDQIQQRDSSLRQTEEEIRQLNAELEHRVVERTAELEAANKELEAFSYSVSHDLRAPLRAVDGFSQAVLDDYGTQLPEEGRRYLRTIRSGAQQMGQLIDDLLAFSRLSRQPLNRRTVNAVNLVREVIEDLNGQRDGRQIDIRIGELPSCHGDPSLLKQVWINLLSNALKYTRKRETAVIEIGGHAQDGETVYYVRDNGTGFDMKYAHKLFGVFQRLHRAEEYEGTGVGLAIVNRIVQRHGGRIWAEAEVDRGATFYLTL